LTSVSPRARDLVPLRSVGRETPSKFRPGVVDRRNKYHRNLRGGGGGVRFEDQFGVYNL